MKMVHIVDPSKKSALIVEGGGLRGAFAVGVLKELYNNYGGPDQFDAIYAVSSGAFSATYFAAHQVNEMENIWKEMVHGRKLLDFHNILCGNSILKLDYLVNIFEKHKTLALNLRNLLRARSVVNYVLTNWNTGNPHYLDAKKFAQRSLSASKLSGIFDLMKASSALHGVYNGKEYIDGTRFVDGVYSDPLPIQRAISDGFTQILVIHTRPKEFIKNPPSRLLAHCCFHGSPLAKESYLNSHNIYNKSLKSITNHNMSCVEIISVRPTALEISSLGRNRVAIWKAIKHGEEEGRKIFDTVQHMNNSPSALCTQFSL